MKPVIRSLLETDPYTFTVRQALLLNRLAAQAAHPSAELAGGVSRELKLSFASRPPRLVKRVPELPVTLFALVWNSEEGVTANA